MSGPKISITTISAADYARMTEEQKIQMSLDSISICIERLEYKIKQVQKYIDYLEELPFESEEASNLIKEMRSFIEELKETLAEARTVTRKMKSHKGS